MHHEAMPLRWFFPPPAGDRGPLRRFGRDAIGLASLLGHTSMRPLPIDVASLIGQELWSRIGRVRFPQLSARISETWARLRPDEAARREAVVLGLWRNIGRVIGEYSVLDRLWAAGRIAVEGAEHLSAARDSGRPVIVAGLHLGNWEVIPPAIVSLGHPMSVIYQRPVDRLDHHLITNARRRYNAGLLPPDPGSARAALRLLQDRRRVLLVYVDEWIDGRVNAPAFGRTPRFSGNIANVMRLAAMTDAALIPAYAVRTEGAHFRLTFLPAVLLTRGGNRDVELAENVARLDAVIAPIVRAHLEQWLMLFDFCWDE